MTKFTFSFLVVLIVSVGCIVYKNSERTFEAKFNNIDGLPNGAKVTALGVEIGKVIKTKPINDGILVTVKITNKSFPYPPAGSQLTITSFRPNQGRVLEIIPPSSELPEYKAWIVKEPITTESWLNASLELSDNLQNLSKKIIKDFTPENFEKARDTFSKTSMTLQQIANHLNEQQGHLELIQKRFSLKADEAALLLLRFRKPIDSLSEIVNDKEMLMSFGLKAKDFASNLNEISNVISSEEYYNDLSTFKNKILTNLNSINATLISDSETLDNSTFKDKIKAFNYHVISLNECFDKLSKKDIKKIAIESSRKTKSATLNLSEMVSQYLKNQD